MSQTSKNAPQIYGKAIHKMARTSPYKARLVVDLVRNRSVHEAKNILSLSKKKAAVLVVKVLDSAVANAVHNQGADHDALRIISAYVDAGRSSRRFRARAKGRVNHIIKRTSHITIGVGV